MKLGKAVCGEENHKHSVVLFHFRNTLMKFHSFLGSTSVTIVEPRYYRGNVVLCKFVRIEFRAAYFFRFIIVKTNQDALICISLYAHYSCLKDLMKPLFGLNYIQETHTTGVFARRL